MELVIRQVFTNGSNQSLESFSFDVKTGSTSVNTDNNYVPWMKTLFRRDSMNSFTSRGKFMPLRNIPLTSDGEPNHFPLELDTTPFSHGHPNAVVLGGGLVTSGVSDSTLVPLYLTTDWDVLNKLDAIGEEQVLFDSFILQNVNTLAQFDLLFKRGSTVGYLGLEIPNAGYYNFVPDPSNIEPISDFLFSKIKEGVYGVYWLKRVPDPTLPLYWAYEDSDPLELQMNSPLQRVGQRFGFPVYASRGLGLIYSTVNVQGDPINSHPIAVSPSQIIESTAYTDGDNPSVSVLTRQGNNLTFRKAI